MNKDNKDNKDNKNTETLTKEGRSKGGCKAHEHHYGWPERQAGNFDRRMLEAGRRFDELGMEVKFKPIRKFSSFP